MVSTSSIACDAISYGGVVEEFRSGVLARESDTEPMDRYRFRQWLQMAEEDAGPKDFTGGTPSRLRCAKSFWPMV